MYKFHKCLLTFTIHHRGCSEITDHIKMKTSTATFKKKKKKLADLGHLHGVVVEASGFWLCLRS